MKSSECTEDYLYRTIILAAPAFKAANFDENWGLQNAMQLRPRAGTLRHVHKAAIRGPSTLQEDVVEATASLGDEGARSRSGKEGRAASGARYGQASAIQASK